MLPGSTPGRFIKKVGMGLVIGIINKLSKQMGPLVCFIPLVMLYFIRGRSYKASTIVMYDSTVPLT